MYNTARRIMNDDEEARDAVQDAFVMAFNKLQQFNGQSTFGAWIKRIVVNHCLDLLRKKKRLLFEQMNEQTDKEEVVEDFSWQDWQLESIKSAMEAMPEGYRSVLSLYLFEGYDHQEIADIMQITESTSKSQFHRAKKKLIEIVKNNYSYEN